MKLPVYRAVLASNRLLAGQRAGHYTLMGRIGGAVAQVRVGNEPLGLPMLPQPARDLLGRTGNLC